MLLLSNATDGDMKSNSERQADYRKRRQTAGDNGERQLNTWMTTAAALALGRLARCKGLPKRQMLEQLILSADALVCAEIDPDSEDWAKYYGVTP